MGSTARWGVWAVGIAAISLLFAATAGAAACNEEVVIGQTLAEVAAICPQPTLKEHRDLWEELLEGKKKIRSATSYDHWVFDTGPQEFMVSLIFLNGKLAELRNLGYGSMRDPMMPECRNGEGLALGDTMVDAYLKCGEPLAREKRGDKAVVSVEGEVTRRTSVAIEEWTYRYGPDLPGYTLRFENGVTAEIRPREFGK
ncbi:DUF2845 domain-containing protein [Geomonas nitrogeniifigens]|uniref:DUF2845 domain-containing protein n=1 Tax=Geomonas diazotrophica TaxID=2843197 RepID=UPI001C2BF20C|nr:DUF2845 domain-containing protein [Geomonas nitrogeniifigens]QXE86239.1 DUF2845 domain-containing protein [Geomonas nitrogeniifigens]